MGESYNKALRKAVVDITSGEISKEEFENRCKAAWVKVNGAVPEGHKLVVGVADNKLIVGHVEEEPSRDPRDPDGPIGMLSMWNDGE